MTKEELEREAEEWVISNTEIYDDKFGIECEEEPRAKEAYLAGAEPREKRIEELKEKLLQEREIYWSKGFECARKKQSEQLAEAKEYIKLLLMNCVHVYENTGKTIAEVQAEAEQFLKEVSE